MDDRSSRLVPKLAFAVPVTEATRSIPCDALLTKQMDKSDAEGEALREPAPQGEGMTYKIPIEEIGVWRVLSEQDNQVKLGRLQSSKLERQIWDSDCRMTSTRKH